MKQRLNIAQAIFESPDIILLDEPTNAIDDSGVILIRNLIKKEAERGAIIILASHSKDDIDDLCDEVLKIEEGETLQIYKGLFESYKDYRIVLELLVE